MEQFDSFCAPLDGDGCGMGTILQGFLSMAGQDISKQVGDGRSPGRVHWPFARHPTSTSRPCMQRTHTDREADR